MTPKQRADRIARATRIEMWPNDYKICEGCECIIRRPLPECPNCGTYRFEFDAGRIIKWARELATREPVSVIEE